MSRDNCLIACFFIYFIVFERKDRIYLTKNRNYDYMGEARIDQLLFPTLFSGDSI